MEQHIIDNLKSLKALLDSGVLSAEEFEKEKKNILCECNNKVSHNQTNTNPQVKTEEPKESVKSHVESNVSHGEKALLYWALIFVVTGIFRELIIFWDSSWYINPSLKSIYFLLNMVGCIGGFLPTLSIKNEKYRTVCFVGIGLFTLYYIFQNFRNMMS